jgi:hypothetical protein
MGKAGTEAGEKNLRADLPPTGESRFQKTAA